MLDNCQKHLIHKGQSFLEVEESLVSPENPLGRVVHPLLQENHLYRQNIEHSELHKNSSHQFS